MRSRELSSLRKYVLIYDRTKATGASTNRVLHQLLRQLQAANNGYLHAIDRALLHAYGRRGRHKHVALRVRASTLPSQSIEGLRSY
jgi:hypothetical protein